MHRLMRLHLLFKPNRRLEVFYLIAKIVVVVGEVAHQVGHAVGQGVELLVDGLLTSSLGILKKRYQKEGDYGRGSVDEQLPGVEVREEESRSPYHHQHHAEREERCLADHFGTTLRETVEVSLIGLLSYLRGSAFAHAFLLFVGTRMVDVL